MIPKEHIATINELCQGEEHYALGTIVVSLKAICIKFRNYYDVKIQWCAVHHMLKTGETLMHRDAPAAEEYR